MIRATVLVAVVLAGTASAQPAQAGFFTKMFLAGGAAACSMNQKCAAKVGTMKDNLVRKCEGSQRCTDFLARHPKLGEFAARTARGSTSLSEALR